MCRRILIPLSGQYWISIFSFYRMVQLTVWIINGLKFATPDFEMSVAHMVAHFKLVSYEKLMWIYNKHVHSQWWWTDVVFCMTKTSNRGTQPFGVADLYFGTRSIHNEWYRLQAYGKDWTNSLVLIWTLDLVTWSRFAVTIIPESLRLVIHGWETLVEEFSD